MSSEQPQILGFLPTSGYWRQRNSAVRWQRALVVLIAGTGGFVLGKITDSELATRALMAVLGSVLLGIVVLGLVERASRRRLKQ